MIEFNNTYPKEDKIQELHREVTKKLEVNNNMTSISRLFFTNSGTSGIVLMMDALDYYLPGMLVAFPSYYHISAFTRFNKFLEMYIDIDPDFPVLTLENVIRAYEEQKFDALFFTEIHGYMGEIDKIKEFCDMKNILLIEDSAPSILQPNAGSYGDFSIFSFSKTKNISLNGGGMLIVNESLFKKVEKIKKEKAQGIIDYIEDMMVLKDKKNEWFYITNMDYNPWLLKELIKKIDNFPRERLKKLYNSITNPKFVKDGDNYALNNIFIKGSEELEKRLKLFKIPFKKDVHKAKYVNSKKFQQNHFLLPFNENLTERDIKLYNLL